MTNYNEKLDKIFETLNNKAREERASCTERNNWDGYNSAYERLESEAKQAIVKWHEIEKSEVYNSGCADTARQILALFDNQIPERLKQWLRLEIEDRGKL